MENKKLTDQQRQKQEAIDLLRKRLTEDVRKRLYDVDYRLRDYFDDCATNVSNVFGDEKDRHSMWELLCAAKFIRMFNTYYFNAKKVQFYLRLREGVWRKQGKAWRYVEGGLKLPSTNGAKVYRWQPFQVFVLATVFGFYTWINTKVEEGTKDVLLDTEREKDGFVWDFRRMVAEFIMYGPRKIDKTGLSSFIQLVFFLFGDFNSEIYSLAMTENQSKILYNRTKFMLRQMNASDEGNPLFRMTEKVIDWLPKYRDEIRNSMIVPLTGGGKAPDGTNTELLNWDELGSSPYINNKSDMQAHINVCQSSMGMRRSPLTFGTTTAGTITTGPFIDMLRGRHDLLLQEFKYENGEAEPQLMFDSQMCLLLEPDEYEKTNEEYILTSHALRRKINPMLGIIVQYDFYDREMAKARQDGEQKFAECVSKLFNTYKGGRVKDWLKPEDIRQLQIDRCIDDCIDSEGWLVFCGFDFSKGDDLNGVSYLAYNTKTGEFFADMDSYMSEKAVNESPIRELLLKWADMGYLHIVPGQTFDPSWPVNRIIELDSKGVNFMAFGYDPFNAQIVMNSLRQWVFDIGLDPKQIIQPVRQNFATYNPAVAEFDYMVKRSKDDGMGHQRPDPMIHFSRNSLWPWEFGNVMLQESSDGMENLKPVKREANGKVDNIQMLLSALILYDASQTQINK